MAIQPTEQVQKFQPPENGAPTLATGRWDHRENTVSYVRANYVSPTSDNGEFGESARRLARSLGDLSTLTRN